MSKEIPLSRGKFAIVDDEDYVWLSQWKWHAWEHHRNWYARRGAIKNGKRTIAAMHRCLLGLEDGDERQGDHIDHNGLNNTRKNLRIANHAQNQHNQRKQIRAGLTSQFKGVHWFRRDYNWQSQIGVKGRQVHLGYFDSEIEAAKAYDNAAREYFGEFAHTNF